MEIVNEKSTAYLITWFRGKTGNLAAPSAVTYRIDCLTTGTEVKAWTAVAPAASVEITLSADDNAILSDSNERERRRVTVVAAYGVGNADQVANDYTYQVRNLHGLP